MKKKRLFLVAVLFICILLSVSVSKANAAEQFYTCNIIYIGSGWGYVMINLTDTSGAFSNTWFYVLGSATLQILATALQR